MGLSCRRKIPIPVLVFNSFNFKVNWAIYRFLFSYFFLIFVLITYFVLVFSFLALSLVILHFGIHVVEKLLFFLSLQEKLINIYISFNKANPEPYATSGNF